MNIQNLFWMNSVKLINFDFRIWCDSRTLNEDAVWVSHAICFVQPLCIYIFVFNCKFKNQHSGLAVTFYCVTVSPWHDYSVEVSPLHNWSPKAIYFTIPIILLGRVLRFTILLPCYLANIYDLETIHLSLIQ